MPLARPSALDRELAAALPQRPFRVEFWAGTALPPTNGGGGPLFRVRSPTAVAHALRAPGQLGLGRAYVTGALEVDDLDALMDVLETWRPPPLGPAVRAQLALAALRAAGVTMPPRRPRTELVQR